jgi:hypothetical protein
VAANVAHQKAYRVAAFSRCRGASRKPNQTAAVSTALTIAPLANAAKTELITHPLLLLRN